jgi:hypothetical protein
MTFVEENSNARFEKAIFNLLRNFNFIDVDVGLLISTIAVPPFSPEIYKKLSRKTFDQRMKWFRKLLKSPEMRQRLGDNGTSEFETWFLRAHNARELRNRYVHGIWRFYQKRVGSPVSISFPIWMKDILGGELEEAMSLDELEAKAVMVEDVLKDFIRIRNKYHI